MWKREGLVCLEYLFSTFGGLRDILRGIVISGASATDFAVFHGI